MRRLVLVLSSAVCCVAVQLVVASPSIATSNVQPPSEARIADPPGDADGDRTNRARRDRADLIRVRYALPPPRGGVATITARFKRYRGFGVADGLGGAGNLNQSFVTIIKSAGRWYSLYAGNASPDVKLRDEDGKIVRTKSAKTLSRVGRGGYLTVEISTEFLEGRHVTFNTYGQSRNFSEPTRTAFDWTKPSTLEFPVRDVDVDR